MNNFGKLEHPLNESKAENLIKVCKQTSFGIFNDNSDANVIRDVDLRVRDSLELEPSQFVVKNPDWQIKIDLLVQRAAEHLSSSFSSVNSDGNKILYRINSHFGRHRDRVKEKNQFGTLVIQLPCNIMVVSLLLIILITLKNIVI